MHAAAHLSLGAAMPRPFPRATWGELLPAALGNWLSRYSCRGEMKERWIRSCRGVLFPCSTRAEEHSSRSIDWKLFPSITRRAGRGTISPGVARGFDEDAERRGTGAGKQGRPLPRTAPIHYAFEREIFRKCNQGDGERARAVGVRATEPRSR